MYAIEEKITLLIKQNNMLFFFFRLFEDEEQDLMKDIQSLPRNSALRKINDLSKRARLAKVSFVYILK